MPPFPKYAHLVKPDTSLSHYTKYLSALNNRDKEQQIIYGDSRDVVLFTYRLMTGEKHDLLPGTERLIHEVVEWHHAQPPRDHASCREELFKALHIAEWERPPPGVSPAFVLYCRASAYRRMRTYQRELRDGKALRAGEPVTAEQLVRSLCRRLSAGVQDAPLDQAAFYALWDAWLVAEGVALDAGRCTDLGRWAAQRGTLEGGESDTPLEDS